MSVIISVYRDSLIISYSKSAFLFMKSEKSKLLIIVLFFRYVNPLCCKKSQEVSQVWVLSTIYSLVEVISDIMLTSDFITLIYELQKYYHLNCWHINSYCLFSQMEGSICSESLSQEEEEEVTMTLFLRCCFTWLWILTFTVSIA